MRRNDRARTSRHRSVRRGVAAAVGLATAGLVATAMPGARAGVLADTLPALPAPVADALAAADPFLGQPPSVPGAPGIPANPVPGFIETLKNFSLESGINRDPTNAVLRAALSPEITLRLTVSLNDLLACTRIAKAHHKAIPASVLKNAAKEYGHGLDPAAFKDVKDCAARVWKSTAELETSLTKAILPMGADLDFWPVIRFSRGNVDNVYRHDYALQVDLGGNDTYDNNAGSNLIDLNYGPPGQAGLKGTAAVAKGCQRAIPGLVAADCTPMAAVLLDLAGNDRYGVRQSPDLDAQCTTDPVVRRMMTNGAGLLGVGVLVDKAGNDTYTGKTGANGGGHIFGVGILHDKAGDDTYWAVRNATGFGLVGGLGVWRDHAGDDRHDFYLPAKLPAASGQNQTPGAGGVIDDEDACDNQPRYNVGGGNVGSVGVAVDDAGNDWYRGGASAEFIAPQGASNGGASSQGYANNQSAAAFVDLAGSDSYSIFTSSLGGDGQWVFSPLANSRGNGVTLTPQIDPATQQGGETGTGGVFQDR